MRKRTCHAGLIVAIVAISVPGVAGAREARCSTTDDGSYDCDFKPIDRRGSFQITGPGKPLYILNMDSPGVAFGFVNLGNRNISLPGRYLRSKTDPACWMGDEAKTQICIR